MCSRLLALTSLCLAAIAGCDASSSEDTASAEAELSAGAAQGLSAGSMMTCATRADGKVTCWGSVAQTADWGAFGAFEDRHGRRITNDDVVRLNDVVIDFGSGRKVRELVTGSIAYSGYDSADSCAVLDDGSLHCWGFSHAAPQPTKIELGGRKARAVALSSGSWYRRFRCILLEDGSVTCDRRGGGALEWAFAGTDPSALSTLGPARAIAAGATHGCVVATSGDVRCWGDNGRGLLGLGRKAPDHARYEVGDIDLGGRKARDVAAGRNFTCALLDDGAVTCWGDNSAGQLGLGDTSARGDDPGEMGTALATVNLGKKAKAIAASNQTACAILEDGSLECWGQNVWGQLGQGDTVDRGDQPGQMEALTPIDLGPGAKVEEVAMSDNHVCARLVDTRIRCWGRNLGQLAGSVNILGESIGDGPGEMGSALAPIRP